MLNQDNIYYHEILREFNKDEFLKAMQEEITNHNDSGNWMPVLRWILPTGPKVMPSVRATRWQKYINGKPHSTSIAANR
jgi:hypothetical protein